MYRPLMKVKEGDVFEDTFTEERLKVIFVDRGTIHFHNGKSQIITILDTAQYKRIKEG